ncbi:hypothetical protein LCGC14_2653590, partial [marine sediment metagenome]
VFLLTKRERYYFDQDAVRESSIGKTHHDITGQGYRAPGQTPQAGNRKSEPLQGSHGTMGHDGDGMRMPEKWDNPLGRNIRTVWEIPTQNFSEAHFATFPEKLVEPMILSGCPKDVCTKCGQGRSKVYEPTEEYKKKLGSWQRGEELTKGFYAPDKQYSCTKELIFKGYTDCGCGAEYRPGIVADIFAGSGTTLKVAAQNGRDWLGIELKQEYIEMAYRRINEGETGISVKEQNAGQLPLFK